MFLPQEQRDTGISRERGLPTAPVKMSDAIRAGCQLRAQQAVGIFFQGGASCAVGAAWEGRFGNENLPGPSKIKEIFGLPDDIYLVDIYERNDSGLSRESIADWLESKGC